MPIVRFEVWKKNGFEEVIFVDGMKIEKGRVYLVKTPLPADKFRLLVFQHQYSLVDPIQEELYFEEGRADYSFEVCSEVFSRPGVTNNEANTLKEAFAILGLGQVEIASGNLFLFKDDISVNQASEVTQRTLCNPLIAHVKCFSKSDWKKRNRFLLSSFPSVRRERVFEVKMMKLDVDESELESLSKSRCLALTLDEMIAIRNHYNKVEIIAQRERRGIPRWPTDVEMEIIAQSWSEHCKHKIFSAEIEWVGNRENAHRVKNISGLYSTYIKRATYEVIKERNLPWAISVFKDNAGIVRFDSTIDYCIKVETHNSPSALDPYGGALTGILGVNRDILGCGMGARPIANTNVFCLAPPSWPDDAHRENWPEGLLYPKTILEGVHKGIEDGGNKSGIPTVNGAFYFDPSFSGKPLIYCGTVGVMPQTLEGGKQTAKKYVSCGDRVVMLGGAVGADGIHGATFSSLVLDDTPPIGVVQIGDPLCQKRVSDFLLEARDLLLYSGVTDNGAGGLSSSVGEMATLTGGATIDLSRCPVKYPGLLPYELMISESQERMTVAVPPRCLSKFLNLAKQRGVAATDLGEFNDSGKLEVFYGNERVAFLDLYFLHHENPTMKLKARFDSSRFANIEFAGYPLKKNLPLSIEWNKILLELLSRPTIASKEKLIRRYDHEVQGATIIKPFCGANEDGPSDSGMIWAYPHGGAKEEAVVVGCGLAPRISPYDPYKMALMAVDEAIRNVVVQGGDLEYCALLDNFCWPDPVVSLTNPDGEEKLGQLVLACQGLYDACKKFGTPLVSGKDSMKNDYYGKERERRPLKISVLPTLLVTALARADARYRVDSSLKSPGDLIYLLGEQSVGMAGSELAQCYVSPMKVWDVVPDIDLSCNANLYRDYGRFLKKKMISSAHDLSEGGLLVALAECMIGGKLGVSICFDATLSKESLLSLFFGEAPGRFLVTIRPHHRDEFEHHFNNIACRFLGVVNKERAMKIEMTNADAINISLDAITTSWKRGVLQ